MVVTVEKTLVLTTVVVPFSIVADTVPEGNEMVTVLEVAVADTFPTLEEIEV
jgi:hypothetical protein